MVAAHTDPKTTVCGVRAPWPAASPETCKGVHMRPQPPCTIARWNFSSACISPTSCLHIVPLVLSKVFLLSTALPPHEAPSPQAHTGYGCGSFLPSQKEKKKKKHCNMFLQGRPSLPSSCSYRNHHSKLFCCSPEPHKFPCVGEPSPATT